MARSKRAATNSAQAAESVANVSDVESVDGDHDNDRDTENEEVEGAEGGWRPAKGKSKKKYVCKGGQ